MNTSLVTSKSRNWLPHMLVLLWLIYLAVTIWQHALHSVQPPLYDELTYIQKAKNFWQAIELGKFFNPLNLEPTVRPPGTILMSYPFGFSPDFHGFHFRSVFLPILCVVAAVYIVAGTSYAKASGWWVAAIAFLFSSLPMFYHFEAVTSLIGKAMWGYVDNFHAGVAGIAAAALVRSLLSKSLPWLFFGAFLAGFTFLIKPSGLMVMALLALAWVIVVAFEWLQLSRLKSRDHSLRIYSVRGGALILGIYLCVIVPCFYSGYLSRTNFAFANLALSVLREMFEIDVYQVISSFHWSSGEALVLWIICVAVIYVYSLLHVRKISEVFSASVLGLLVSSLFTWLLGAWYWLVVQAGATQIRYFQPFMLMGAVCIIPAAMSVWQYTNRYIRIMLLIICVLPALNIASLLAAGDTPSTSWQKTAGVSVSVGTDREVVRQAYAFLDELRKSKNNVQFYSFASGLFPFIFENVGSYEITVRPGLTGFNTVIPIDWERGFAVRVEELLASDYILIQKYGNEIVSNVPDKKFDLFASEVKVFELWLATLDERSGVEIASDGQALRVLRIVDRRKLKQVIDAFVAKHSWRPEFVAANKPVWWSAETVSAYTRNLAVEEVDFGGIYRLHALVINWVESGIQIEAWWEELRHDELNNQRILFLHLVDSSGNILSNQQIELFPYNPWETNRRWHYSKKTFNNRFPDEKVDSLALGIYHPNGTYLLGDKGQTDWGGKRILIPINAKSVDSAIIPSEIR